MMVSLVVRRRTLQFEWFSGEGRHITHARAMQIIELERDDWNFFCPATGRPVFTEHGEPNTPALRGNWCHELPDEPMNLSEELQASWDAYLKNVEEADEDVDVVAFLGSVEQANWVAFEITTCGMACGPVWSTTWTVLDLGEVSC